MFKRFDGKTAWWLWLLFMLYNLIPVGIIVFDKDFIWNLENIISFAVLYALNIIWLPILIRDWVDVYEDRFVFYYGFAKYVIYFDDIVSISKSHNPISATANSFDRIHIVTKKKGFYLSLYKNDEFISEVSSKLKTLPEKEPV